ncbi:hypothetical protein [Streptosporangium sp. NPDC002607]
MANEDALAAHGSRIDRQRLRRERPPGDSDRPLDSPDLLTLAESRGGCQNQLAAYNAAAQAYADARVNERIALLSLESAIAAVGAARMTAVNCRSADGPADIATCLSEAGLSLHSAQKAREAAELSFTVAKEKVQQALAALRTAHAGLTDCAARSSWRGTIRITQVTDHSFTRDTPPIGEQRPRQTTRHEEISMRRNITVVGRVTGSWQTHLPHVFVLRFAGGIQGVYEWRKRVVTTRHEKCADGQWTEAITKEEFRSDYQDREFGIFDMEASIPSTGTGTLTLRSTHQGQMSWSLPLNIPLWVTTELRGGCSGETKSNEEKIKLKSSDWATNVSHASGSVTGEGREFRGLIEGDSVGNLICWPDGWPDDDAFPRLATPVHYKYQWDLTAG